MGFDIVQSFIFLRVWHLSPFQSDITQLHRPGLEQVPPFWHGGVHIAVN